MNILFLSLGRYWSINESEGYTDLLREFIRHGDKIYILSPTERREGKETQLIEEENSVILKVKTGNIQKTNFIEKGISTVMIESQFLKAIKKYFSDVKFDLVLYPTPPITFVKVVEYVKKHDRAKTYLLLKDIFPQNAVDIGIMSTTGIKGLLYKYFRRKEKKLYQISDTIGCMSPANVQYVLDHNHEVEKSKVEVCPNVIEIVDKSIDGKTREKIRNKYGIPIDKKVFVYGGNLGRPQGIDFLIECIKSQKDNKNAFFFIVGDGTDYGKLEEFYNSSPQDNFKFMKRLPKEDYDTVVAASDVGLIFLDNRFTIPNFPSRLLGYMQAKLPVLACTDPNTDIGKVIVDGGFGWWCESNNIEAFGQLVTVAINADTSRLGEIGYEYLQDNYTVERGYEIIQRRLK
ncbi:glycosyltransferase family 4 protein [Chordicoccus furentiruminis]|uniref:glycosyltransferase family 4 protein n=1 Tax=Chordicoccus furentiruminis TaxID=2709410 RepID=UPI0023A7B26B|nr:glycosyltransferase family 4 protein [Chordicoccus furentiruminis]